MSGAEMARLIGGAIGAHPNSPKVQKIVQPLLEAGFDKGIFPDPVTANEEWRRFQELLKRHADDPNPRHTKERSRRWVLITTFGSTLQFHQDPVFHARVCAVEQMLELIDELSAS